MYLVSTREQQVEESDDGPLKLHTAGSSDGVRGEGLPDDALADVGGNEEGDARAQTVAVLQHLIQADDNDASEEELHSQ